MKLVYDSIFPYRGYPEHGKPCLGCPSYCHLSIFDHENHAPYTVVVTELDDNPGTSITNAAEKIATQVWKFLERPDRGMTWIEHYRDRAFIAGRPTFKEQFGIVIFEQIGDTFRHPRWRRISKNEAEALCGCCLG